MEPINSVETLSGNKLLKKYFNGAIEKNATIEAPIILL
jgi:hypothetical protein